MEAATVYIKTSDGREEMSSRARRLSAREGATLIMIDGRRCLAELRRLSPTPEEVTLHLQAFLDAGLIAPLASDIPETRLSALAAEINERTIKSSDRLPPESAEAVAEKARNDVIDAGVTAPLLSDAPETRPSSVAAPVTERAIKSGNDPIRKPAEAALKKARDHVTEAGPSTPLRPEVPKTRPPAVADAPDEQSIKSAPLSVPRSTDALEKARDYIIEIAQDTLGDEAHLFTAKLMQSDDTGDLLKLAYHLRDVVHRFSNAKEADQFWETVREIAPKT